MQMKVRPADDLHASPEGSGGRFRFDQQLAAAEAASRRDGQRAGSANYCCANGCCAARGFRRAGQSAGQRSSTAAAKSGDGSRADRSQPDDQRRGSPARANAGRGGQLHFAQRGWIRAADDDEVDRAYRPDDSQLQVLYFLAGADVARGLVVGLAGPDAFPRQHASGWVAAVLLMSAADLVYIVWLLSLTDWSTLRVGMMLCAASAAAYACGLAMVEGTPDAEPIALGLSDVRSSAGLWCALQMGLLSGMCYGFGRQASLWRDEAREMGPM